MAISALIYTLSVDPRGRGKNQGIEQQKIIYGSAERLYIRAEFAISLPLPRQQYSCCIRNQPDSSPARILQRLCKILFSLQRFQYLPNAVPATYISSGKGVAGLSLRYSRAIHVFEIEFAISHCAEQSMLNATETAVCNLSEFYWCSKTLFISLLSLALSTDSFSYLYNFDVTKTIAINQI